MSRKKNHRIALTDKFSIIAAHHCKGDTKEGPLRAYGTGFQGQISLFLSSHPPTPTHCPCTCTVPNVETQEAKYTECWPCPPIDILLNTV